MGRWPYPLLPSGGGHPFHLNFHPKPSRKRGRGGGLRCEGARGPAGPALQPPPAAARGRPRPADAPRRPPASPHPPLRAPRWRGGPPLNLPQNHPLGAERRAAAGLRGDVKHFGVYSGPSSGGFAGGMGSPPRRSAVEAVGLGGGARPRPWWVPAATGGVGGRCCPTSGPRSLLTC